MNLRLDVLLKETGSQNVMIRLESLLKVRRFWRMIDLLLEDELRYQAEQLEKQKQNRYAHPLKSR